MGFMWAKEIEEKLDRLVELAGEQAEIERCVLEWWEDQLKIGKVPNDGHIELFNSIPLDDANQDLISPRVSEINEHLSSHLHTIKSSLGTCSGEIWGHPEKLVLCRMSNHDIACSLWRNVKKYIADETF